MFIKKVYRYSKPLAIGMLFFVAVQLFCFYKGGMVFSPWYNYGMYSEVIIIKDKYITSNIPLLRGNDYSPQDWDRYYYTLQQFSIIDTNRIFYENEVKRIFMKCHLPVPEKSHFIPESDTNAPWYKNYTLMLRMYKGEYIWNNNFLEKIK